MLGSGKTTSIIYNEEINNIMEQNGGFLSILLATLDASLLRNISVDKCSIIAGKGAIATSRVRGTIRAGLGF